jgi:YesN/AraC family two-component response regulator
MRNKKPPFTLTEGMLNAVVEIAEVVGYQNPHYFTSMFKSKMGVTPTEYRKKFI